MRPMTDGSTKTRPMLLVRLQDADRAGRCSSSRGPKWVKTGLGPAFTRRLKGVEPYRPVCFVLSDSKPA